MNVSPRSSQFGMPSHAVGVNPVSSITASSTPSSRSAVPCTPPLERTGDPCVRTESAAELPESRPGSELVSKAIMMPPEGTPAAKLGGPSDAVGFALGLAVGTLVGFAVG